MNHFPALLLCWCSNYVNQNIETDYNFNMDMKKINSVKCINVQVEEAVEVKGSWDETESSINCKIDK